MSELPHPSPDSSREKAPYHLEGVPEALQIEAIERLREAQALHEHTLVSKEPWNDLAAQAERRKEARDDFKDMINAHLVANGVDTGDDKYAEYADFLRERSIDNVTREEWENGSPDVDEDKRVPYRLETLNKVREEYSTEPTPEDPEEPEDPPEPLETPEEKERKLREALNGVKDLPEIKALTGEVDALRDKLAGLSAKRQKRFMTFRKSRTGKEYAEVQEEYQQKLNELIKAELAAEKAAGLDRTEEDERLDVAQKLMGDFNALRDRSVEILKGTKRQKIMDWMTSGGAFKRIGKALIVGLPIGVAGAAVTFFTGGAALAVGLATGVGLAGKLGISYAKIDNIKGRGLQSLDQAEINDRNSRVNLEAIHHAGAHGKSGEESADLINQHLMDKFEADTKKQQRKRLGSVALSAAFLAAGSAAAEGVHLFAGAMGTGGGANHIAQKPSAPGDVPPASVAPPEPVEHLYSPEVTTLHAGQGGYQLLENMNIPKEDWHNLWQEVGPQLQNVKIDSAGHGFAYQMHGHPGEFGLRMTPDGKVPKEVLDIISHAHDHMHGGTHLNAEGAADVAPVSGSGSMPDFNTLSAPINHDSVANVIKMGYIDSATIANNPQLELLTNVSPRLGVDTFAHRVGIPNSEWFNHLKPYIVQQLDNGNTMYEKAFKVTSDNVLRFNGTKLPESTVADLLNKIPGNVRETMSSY